MGELLNSVTADQMAQLEGRADVITGAGLRAISRVGDLAGGPAGHACWDERTYRAVPDDHLSGPVSGQLLRSAALVTTGVTVACVVATPRLLRLGATKDEAHRPMPGDDEVPQAQVQGTRAVTVDAPPQEVWPWIAQIGYHGYGRAGWYAFDLADNDGVPSAWKIIPEFQQPRVGQVIGEEGSTIRVIEPERLLVLSYHWPKTVWVRKQGLWPKFGHCSWVFVLKPSPGNKTRLLVRTRYRSGPVDRSLPFWPMFFVVDLLMQPMMLRGIKRRAEWAGQQPGERMRATAATASTARLGHHRPQETIC